MIPISGKLGAAPRGALIGAVVFGLIGAIDWPKPLVIRWEINGIQQPIGPIGRASRRGHLWSLSWGHRGRTRRQANSPLARRSPRI